MQLQQEAEREKVEAEWPEYRTRDGLCFMPTYCGKDVEWNKKSKEDQLLEADVWKEAYEKDLQEIQSTRQHHIHPIDQKTGERRPLVGCGRSDGRDECGKGFPFEKQTSEEAMVVCAGVAETFSLPVTGRRNALGSLFGPRSCGWLNGSHPALLIGGRGNSDVQLAMRMPITAASHWKNCSQECVGQADLAALQRVMQAAQAAQIGYSTDYLTKRQAKGLYECREFARGHAALSGKLVEEGASVGQVTRRHAQRLVADCFVRGVARGAVETENLNMETTRTRHDPCAAECIQTFSCVTFPGAALLEIVERAVAGEAPRARAGLVQVGEDGEPRLRDMAMLYALRGGDAAVAYLSPYEWVRYWAVVPRAKAEVAVAEGRRALAFPPNSFCSELSQTFG